MKIGITFASTSREYEKDPLQALDKIAEAGYTIMEFGRDDRIKPEDLHQEVTARGITPVSGHFLIDDFSDEKFEDTLDYANKLGVSTLVVPWVYDEMICDYETSVKTAKMLDDLATRVKERGFDLIYHNHWTEFVKIYEGKYVEDIFFENTSVMGFELDIGWAYAGGCDVAPYIKKLGSRLKFIHIKDVKDFGIEKEEKNIPVEVGTGKVNIKECVDAAASVGVKFGIVEQDAVSKLYSDSESIQLSRKNLRGFGY